jgi:hypothetical protein
MTDYDAALSSAKKKAWLLGIVGAVLISPMSAIGGGIASLCCLGGFLGALGVVCVPPIMAFVAGMLVDWSSMPQGSGLATGAGMGARAGGTAALLGAGLTWVIGVGLSMLMSVITAMSYSDDIAGVLIQVVIGSAFSMVWQGMIALVAGVIGMLLGVAAGAVAGMIRGPA